MFEPRTKGGAGWPANSGQLARLRATSLSFPAHRRIPAPPTAWLPSAFRFSPLVATGLALCLVDLMTALLAMRLFGRVHATVPGSGAPSDYWPQTLLLALAASSPCCRYCTLPRRSSPMQRAARADTPGSAPPA